MDVHKRSGGKVKAWADKEELNMITNCAIRVKNDDWIRTSDEY